MTDAPDPVTTYLDEVRERYNAGADYPLAGNVQAITDSSDDVPRLVAALDGVLALVAGAEAWDGRPLDGWALNPATVRAAISDALLGENSSSEGDV